MSDADERDEAARKLQSLWHRRRALRMLRSMVAEVFTKVWDEGSQSYYYFNNRTGESQWTKPKVLGSEDLPLPTTTTEQAEDVAATVGASGWARLFDDGSGREYFFNTITQETQWDVPAELLAEEAASAHAGAARVEASNATAVEVSGDVAAVGVAEPSAETANEDSLDVANARDGMPDERTGYVELLHEESGRLYYHNATTGDTVWEKPEGFGVPVDKEVVGFDSDPDSITESEGEDSSGLFRRNRRPQTRHVQGNVVTKATRLRRRLRQAQQRSQRLLDVHALEADLVEAEEVVVQRERVLAESTEVLEPLVSKADGLKDTVKTMKQAKAPAHKLHKVVQATKKAIEAAKDQKLVVDADEASLAEGRAEVERIQASLVHARTLLTADMDLSLEYLDIVSIPTDCWHIEHLQRLDLSHNKIRKLSPSIQFLTAVTDLSVADNLLTVLPRELWLLTQLVELDLSSNRLKEVYDDSKDGNVVRKSALDETIGDLKLLKRLDLSSNFLSFLPEPIKGCRSLVELKLAENRIDEIPKHLGYLTGLTELDLRENELLEIPPELARLHNLRSLNIVCNNMGEVPDMSLYTSLMTLDARCNCLEELPDLAAVSSLTSLDACMNELLFLPTSIGYLTNIVELGLGHNEIRWIPDELRDLAKATEVDISHNKIKKLPESLGGMSALWTLDASHNRIAKLPVGLCFLTSITDLDLSHNKLKSLTPSMDKLEADRQQKVKEAEEAKADALLSRAKAESERALDNASKLPKAEGKAERKQIKAKLEAATAEAKTVRKAAAQALKLWSKAAKDNFGHMTSLTCVDISHNKIAELPRSVGHLHSLTELDASFNELVLLPDTFVKMTALVELNLSHNALEALPENIGRRLLRLEELHVSHNKISRMAPLDYDNNVRYIDASYNELSRPIVTTDKVVQCNVNGNEKLNAWTLKNQARARAKAKARLEKQHEDEEELRARGREKRRSRRRSSVVQTSPSPSARPKGNSGTAGLTWKQVATVAKLAQRRRSQSKSRPRLRRMSSASLTRRRSVSAPPKHDAEYDPSMYPSFKDVGDDVLNRESFSAVMLTSRAMKLMDERMYEDAEMIISQCLDLTQRMSAQETELLRVDFVQLRLLRAKCRRGLSDIPGAYLDALAALRLRSNDAQVLHTLGAVLLMARRPVEAIRRFDEAMAQRPNIGIRIDRAKALRRAGRFRAALADIRVALVDLLQVDKTLTASAQDAEVSRLVKGYQESITKLAEKRLTDNADERAAAQAANQDLRDKEEMAKFFEESKKQEAVEDHDAASSAAAAAASKVETSAIEGASGGESKAKVDIDDGDASVQFALVPPLLSESQAYLSARMSVGLHEAVVDMMYERAVCYVRMSRTVLAEAELGTILKLCPDSGNARYMRGLVYRKIGQAGAASHDFSQAIKSLELRLGVGSAAKHEKKKRKAERLEREDIMQRLKMPEEARRLWLDEQLPPEPVPLLDNEKYEQSVMLRDAYFHRSSLLSDAGAAKRAALDYAAGGEPVKHKEEVLEMLRTMEDEADAGAGDEDGVELDAVVAAKPHYGREHRRKLDEAAALLKAAEEERRAARISKAAEKKAQEDAKLAKEAIDAEHKAAIAKHVMRDRRRSTAKQRKTEAKKERRRSRIAVQREERRRSRASVAAESRVIAQQNERSESKGAEDTGSD